MGIKIFDPLLVTPEEAVTFGKHYGGTGTLNIVHDIESCWGRQYEDAQYNYYCMLSAIFEAGYIQGKREERRRIAERNEKQAERIRTDAKEQYRQSAKIYLDATGSTEALKLQSELVFNVWNLWKNKGKFQDETT